MTRTRSEGRHGVSHPGEWPSISNNHAEVVLSALMPNHAEVVLPVGGHNHAEVVLSALSDNHAEVALSALTTNHAEVVLPQSDDRREVILVAGRDR